jgi:hypothetical protein
MGAKKTQLGTDLSVRIRVICIRVDLLKFCVDLFTQKVNANVKKVNAEFQMRWAFGGTTRTKSSSALRAPPPKEDRLRCRSLPGLTGAQPNFQFSTFNFQFNRGEQFVEKNVIT